MSFMAILNSDWVSIFGPGDDDGRCRLPEALAWASELPSGSVHVHSCIDSVVESPHHFGVCTVACIITASLREKQSRDFHINHETFARLNFLKQY
jgi:hypothetical protein